MNTGKIKSQVNAEEQKKWMEQWKAAASALKAHRIAELKLLSEERNAVIASSFFPAQNDLRRNSETSGLVDQQEIFQRARLR